VIYQDMVHGHHPFTLAIAASTKIISGKTWQHQPKRREQRPLTALNAPEKVIVIKEELKLWCMTQ